MKIENNIMDTYFTMDISNNKDDIKDIISNFILIDDLSDIVTDYLDNPIFKTLYSLQGYTISYEMFMSDTLFKIYDGVVIDNLGNVYTTGLSTKDKIIFTPINNDTQTITHNITSTVKNYVIYNGKLVTIINTKNIISLRIDDNRYTKQLVIDGFINFAYLDLSNGKIICTIGHKSVSDCIDIDRYQYNPITNMLEIYNIPSRNIFIYKNVTYYYTMKGSFNLPLHIKINTYSRNIHVTLRLKPRYAVHDMYIYIVDRAEELYSRIHIHDILRQIIDNEPEHDNITFG